MLNVLCLVVINYYAVVVDNKCSKSMTMPRKGTMTKSVAVDVSAIRKSVKFIYWQNIFGSCVCIFPRVFVLFSKLSVPLQRSGEESAGFYALKIFIDFSTYERESCTSPIRLNSWTINFTPKKTILHPWFPHNLQ